MNAEAEIRANVHVVEWREVGGEIVAVQLRDATYLAFNRTATTLWPYLVDGTTRAKLISVLRESFSVAQATAELDVDRFLETLSEHGLLEDRSSGSGSTHS